MCGVSQVRGTRQVNVLPLCVVELVHWIILNIILFYYLFYYLLANILIWGHPRDEPTKRIIDPYMCRYNAHKSPWRKPRGVETIVSISEVLHPSLSSCSEFLLLSLRFHWEQKKKHFSGGGIVTFYYHLAMCWDIALLLSVFQAGTSAFTKDTAVCAIPPWSRKGMLQPNASPDGI